MEVHHHPHVEKKSFKEYLLEGLMIFLAVTMGFVAENLREYLGDHGKEKEYVLNIKNDLKADTATLNIWLPAIQDNIARLDSLISLLEHPDTSKGKELYYFARLATRTRLYESNDNTLTELKNSGNFRLIHSKALLNGIINIEKLQSRYTKLNDIASEESQLMYPLIGTLFDASVFQQMVVTPGKNEASSESDYAENSKRFFKKSSSTPQLRKQDKDIINQLIYYIHQRRSTFDGEIRTLNGIKKITTELIDTINKEYHLQ